MIDKIIEKIKNNGNYSMQNCVVDYVKEKKNLILIHFKEDGKPYVIGKQYFYLVDKLNNDIKMLYIPNNDNFGIINSFNK